MSNPLSIGCAYCQTAKETMITYDSHFSCNQGPQYSYLSAYHSILKTWRELEDFKRVINMVDVETAYLRSCERPWLQTQLSTSSITLSIPLQESHRRQQQWKSNVKISERKCGGARDSRKPWKQIVNLNYLLLHQSLYEVMRKRRIRRYEAIRTQAPPQNFVTSSTCDVDLHYALGIDAWNRGRLMPGKGEEVGIGAWRQEFQHRAAPIGQRWRGFRISQRARW